MRRSLLVAALSCCLLASGVGRATGDTQSWVDEGGGAASYLDIRTVKVGNTAEGVLVRLRIHPIDFDEFNPVGEVLIRIDTNRASAGPEFEERVGIPGHGDFRALKGTRRWKASWRTHVPRLTPCGRTVVERFNVQEGRIRILIRPKRGCLYHPKRVRVNVRTIERGYYARPGYRGYTENDPPLVDHFPTRGEYTPWIRYSWS